MTAPAWESLTRVRLSERWYKAFDTRKYFDPESKFISNALSIFNQNLNTSVVQQELQKIREQIIISNQSLNEINSFTQTSYYENRIAQIQAAINEAEKDDTFGDIMNVVNVATSVAGIAGAVVGVGDAVSSTGALLRALDGSFSDRANQLWNDRALRKSLEDFAKKAGENGAKASAEFKRLSSALDGIGGQSADELQKKLEATQREFEDALAEFALRKVAVEEAMNAVATDMVTPDDKRYRVLVEFSAMVDIFLAKALIGIFGYNRPDLALRCSRDLANMLASVTPFDVSTMTGTCLYAVNLSSEYNQECKSLSVVPAEPIQGITVPVC